MSTKLERTKWKWDSIKAEAKLSYFFLSFAPRKEVHWSNSFVFEYANEIKGSQAHLTGKKQA